MNDPLPKKLSKAERREQLLETALAIVREQGTDALTLGYLAERAGVSKPIAYEHFKTRSGLLIALYEQIDNRQVAALLLALERTPRRLEEVARVVSTAYMNCFTSVGPEWHAISAALKGDEEMDAFQRELIDSYVALYRDALAPYSKLPEDELRLRCVGIIGAGDAIARDMVRGRIDEAAAAASLASLIVGWLAAKA
ncbi:MULTISPECIES: TetR/AcrR family transcriptional regulator [unclassified Variovorax]|uniref:TetR/AcrR family transcriptional regulator n=1 Tax=unclassified Variovorax TaxID=663243 RepID=UPI00088C7F97|nr:TetR/AcrR family transcriptional regulator [Variovorax sp. CF079]SDD39199.1 transcriptional regulator, TetR family [Variovorax sp. CF079]